MKISILILSSFAFCTAFAQAPAAPNAAIGPTVKNAQATVKHVKGTHPIQYRRRVKLYKDGGLVPALSNGKHVRIINSQSIIPDDQVEEVAAAIRQTARFAVNIVKSDNAATVPADEKTGASIYLVANDSDPRILVAPEDAWSRVNVKALTKDAPKPEVLKARFTKECWRGLAISLGASNSMMQPCIMHDVFELKDLEENDLLVPCPEPFNKIMNTARARGIEPGKMVLYRKAVKEGWAPEPKTDVQRKIKENPDVEIELPAELQAELNKLLVPSGK